MSKIITPTVGRKVWYRHDGSPILGQYPMRLDSQPMDATVVYVWGDRMVNLLATDHNGTVFPIFSVTLVQPGDNPPAAGRYAEWMPYQIKATDEARGELSPIDELMKSILASASNPPSSVVDDAIQTLAEDLHGDAHESDYGSSGCMVDGTPYLTFVCKTLDEPEEIATSLLRELSNAKLMAGQEEVDVGQAASVIVAQQLTKADEDISLLQVEIDGVKVSVLAFKNEEPLGIMMTAMVEQARQSGLVNEI